MSSHKKESEKMKDSHANEPIANDDGYDSEDDLPIAKLKEITAAKKHASKRQKVNSDTEDDSSEDKFEVVAKKALWKILSDKFYKLPITSFQADEICALLEAHPDLYRAKNGGWSSHGYDLLMFSLVERRASLDTLRRVHELCPQALEWELEVLATRPYTRCALQEACCQGVGNDIIQFLIDACPRAVSMQTGGSHKHQLPIHWLLDIQTKYKMHRGKIPGDVETIKKLLDVYPESLTETNEDHRNACCLKLALASKYSFEVLTFLVERLIASEMDHLSIVAGKDTTDPVVAREGNICQLLKETVSALTQLLPKLKSFKMYACHTKHTQTEKLLCALSQNKSITNLLLGIQTNGNIAAAKVWRLTNGIKMLLHKNSALVELTICGKDRSSGTFHGSYDEPEASNPNLQDEFFNLLAQGKIPSTLKKLTLCKFLVSDTTSLCRLLDGGFPSPLEEVDFQELKIQGPWRSAPHQVEMSGTSTLSLNELSIEVNARLFECAEAFLSKVATRYRGTQSLALRYIRQDRQELDATDIVLPLLKEDSLRKLRITGDVSLNLLKIVPALKQNTSLAKLDATVLLEQNAVDLLLDILEHDNTVLGEFEWCESDYLKEGCIERLHYLLKLNKFGRRVACSPGSSKGDLLSLLQVPANANEKRKSCASLSPCSTRAERVAMNAFNALVLSPLEKFNVHFGLLLESAAIWSRQ